MAPTLIAALAAVGVTTSILAILAVHDPKRVRTVARAGGSRGRTFGTSTRFALGCASVVPGVMLALYGQWPEFLIWFGMSSAFGWVLTVILAPPPRKERGRRVKRPPDDLVKARRST